MPADRTLIEPALEQARKSLAEGGQPIGAVLLDSDGTVLGAGHNRIAQDGDHTAHAEIDAIRRAGEVADFSKTTLVTTVEPCWMCGGSVLQLGIPRVIVGRTTLGIRVAWLRQFGVAVTELHDRASSDLLDDYHASVGVALTDRPLPEPDASAGPLMTVQRWASTIESRRVTVPEQRTALLVIDMQRGFCEPEEFLGIAPGPEPFAAAIPGCAALLTAARRAGVPVAFTRAAYFPDYSDQLPPRGWQTGSAASPTFAAGSRMAEIVEELAPRAGEVVIDKVRPGAFAGTRLETWLNAQDIRSLVLCGVTTNICVETTAREAYARGYDVYVPYDATGEAEPNRQLHALYAMDFVFGTVCAVSDVERSWA